MNASTPLAADPAVVRAHIEAIHAAAARAFEGVSDPGMLQLVRIHPAGGDAYTVQFAIGEVEPMIREAVMWSNTGFNVYVEGRTVRKSASRHGRGKIGDTVGVFAFITDADGDKGRAGNLGVPPSFVIETSPDNAHQWLVLSRALPPEEAKALGAAIRASARADADTGVITQPYRVAGTVNYPGKTKIARGRVAVPTRIVELGGKVWSPEELRAAFPEPERTERKAGPRQSGTSGKESETVEAIVAETDAPDRSGRFFDAIRAAFAEGLTPDDVESLMRQHPDGCAGKYLEPYDRLADEIERAWSKVEAKAEEVRQASGKPAYEDASSPIEEARDAVSAAVLAFLEAAASHNLAGDETADPPVHALAVSTGVGKTQATARALAVHIRSRFGAKRVRPILYAVPTHRLGDEVERQFAEYGVTARVFRGRQAPDPDRPGQTMCDDLEAVEIALSLGDAVSGACCRFKPKGKPELKCQHFHACSYQAQQTDRPQVWIVAHQMLFHVQEAIGEVELVVIDEGFWQSGLIIPKSGLTLDEITAPLPLGKTKDDALQNDVESYRALLARGLQVQDRTGIVGGVRREHLVRVGLTTDLCTLAIDAEWKLKGEATIWPGMPRAERRRAARVSTAARHARSYIAIWASARGLLYGDGIEASGHLYIERRNDDGEGHVLVVKARGIKHVVEPLRVPTLLLDATLPSPDILRAFYPQVVIPAPIEAAMPHVRVRQVLEAPVSSNKLRLDKGETDNRNLRAVRREILRRFLAVGRQPMLVVAQKAAADWLRGSKLPAGVSVEHFNNVAGLDAYRDVRALMVVGRTAPTPAAVEALAGAITEREPALIPEGQWYGKTVRGIRTRDGRPAGMECDTHPDPVAEACRWQICEGELIQAIGRARGVNRTAETPLDVDVVADVCLPLTVDEVATWSNPGEEFEMVIDGVVLDSAADMAVAWPEVWPTAGAARNWVYRRAGSGESTVTEPYREYSYIGFCDSARRFRYQRPGNGQKWRTGAYDPAVVPDIRAWLESRLGPLAGFEIPPTPAPPPKWPRSVDLAPALVAHYRCVVDIPARPMPTKPVIPEIVRFDPDAPPAPDSVYVRLLADLRSGRLAAFQRLHPPMTPEARRARYDADMAAGGAQTLEIARVLARTLNRSA